VSGNAGVFRPKEKGILKFKSFLNQYGLDKEQELWNEINIGVEKTPENDNLWRPLCGAHNCGSHTSKTVFRYTVTYTVFPKNRCVWLRGACEEGLGTHSANGTSEKTTSGNL